MCRESDNWLTAHFDAHIGHWAHCPIIEHIRQSDLHARKRAVTRVSDVCMESQTIGSLHILMHTLVIAPTAILHEHIRQSVHFTFTSTHQVHVNVQWPEWLTCACKCAESHTIGSLHIFMHRSIIGPTAQLHERIRQSDHCTFTSIHQVHENKQWPECLTCACKCAES